MGIISSDTLEGSDTLNRNAKYSDGKKKRNLAKQIPMQPGLQQRNKAWQNTAVSSSNGVRVSQLGHVSQDPTCPAVPLQRGRSSLSPCSVQVGGRAVTGWVPRGASRLCTQPPPALKLSFQWLSFAYWTCLRSSCHTMGEISQLLSLIPHYKDVDRKSPGSDRLPGVCCDGPRCLSHYIFPWYSRHVTPG